MKHAIDEAGMQRWLPWALRASTRGEVLPDLRDAVRDRLAGRGVPAATAASPRLGWRVMLAVAAALVAMTVYWITPERSAAKHVAAQPGPQEPAAEHPARPQPVSKVTEPAMEPVWCTVDDDVGIAALTDACTALRLRFWGKDGAAAVLRKVPKLTHLDLSLEANVDLSLDDTDFLAIAGLSSLRLLRLDGRAEIDVVWWSALTALPLLEVLRAPHVVIGDVGVAAIARLPSLCELEIACDPTLTDAGLAALAGVPALRRLSLRHCGELTATGLAMLGSLRQLESLDLTAVTGRALEKVERMAPAARRATYERVQRYELNVIRQKGDDAGGGCDDTVLAALAACPRLRELRLECTAVTAAGLAKLGKIPLRRLAFGVTAVADVESLPTTLVELDVSFAVGLDDEALRAIAARLPRLETLALQGCSRVTDAGLRAVLAAAAMTRLDLRGCKGITAAILPQLLEERSLVALDVSGAAWVDAEAEAKLKALPGMREFVCRRGGGGMRPK